MLLLMPIEAEELTSAHLGRDVRAPGVPSFRPRHRWTVADIARESWFDGCLGEGVAAALAWQQAANARDPLERAVLLTIAKDESGHGRLAADILAWCAALESHERMVARPLPPWLVQLHPKHASVVLEVAIVGVDGQVPSQRHRADQKIRI